jgi:hypothetical protein
MNFLYYLSLILILLWLVGFLAMNLGALIHILLVFALLSVLLRLIRGRGI